MYLGFWIKTRGFLCGDLWFLIEIGYHFADHHSGRHSGAYFLQSYPVYSVSVSSICIQNWYPVYVSSICIPYLTWEMSCRKVQL